MSSCYKCGQSDYSDGGIGCICYTCPGCVDGGGGTYCFLCRPCKICNRSIQMHVGCKECSIKEK